MNRRDIVLLGGPGAGKGTQAQILCAQFGYQRIATGDLLREHRAQGSSVGLAAQGYMQRGELVPDELIIAMVQGELHGDAPVLFDGFPRTVAQAQALDALLEGSGRGIPQAIYFKIERALLEERLLGRWTNPRNGRVYHERFDPPKQPGIDDEDGGVLVQREDDGSATIQTRLDVFEAQTLPLVAFYSGAGATRLVTIDATLPVDDVTHALVLAIGFEAAR